MFNAAFNNVSWVSYQYNWSIYPGTCQSVVMMFSQPMGAAITTIASSRWYDPAGGRSDDIRYTTDLVRCIIVKTTSPTPVTTTRRPRPGSSVGKDASCQSRGCDFEQLCCSTNILSVVCQKSLWQRANSLCGKSASCLERFLCGLLV